LIEPEPPVDADRIPVTDAHKKSVLRHDDRLDAARCPARRKLMSPDSCRTGSRTFLTGGCATIMKLDFKRLENRAGGEGDIPGPALVCAIYFTPVAGYIPTVR